MRIRYWQEIVVILSAMLAAFFIACGLYLVYLNEDGCRERGGVPTRIGCMAKENFK